jgi:2-polyprenyl-3-methyl-5-hydroxy-6-metoxy-1,4-benzoquinol methylase
MRLKHRENGQETGDRHAAVAGEQDLSEAKAVCGICGKATATRRFARNIAREGGSYDLFFCHDCEIGATSPFPSSDVLSRLYASNNYRSDDGTRFNAVLESLVRYFTGGKARQIGKFQKSKGSLLDIGCGRGLFLDIMKKDGWRVTGVEFNEETASYAKRAYELNIISPQAMMALPDESFDVITLYHVLEHSQDPITVLHTCVRLLKKNGLLVIAVPNLSSLQAVLGRSRWFHLDIPYHLYHFTLAGLRRLLVDNSMRIEKVQQFDFEQNIFGWMQTLLNVSGNKFNLLYNLLKNPELRGREFAAAGKGDVLITLLLTPIYLPLSIILSLVESLVLKRGGTIHIFASKQ